MGLCFHVCEYNFFLILNKRGTKSQNIVFFYFLHWLCDPLQYLQTFSDVTWPYSRRLEKSQFGENRFGSYDRMGNQSVSLHCDSKWHSICIFTKSASVSSNNSSTVSNQWPTEKNWWAANQVISLTLFPCYSHPFNREINLQLSVIACQKDIHFIIEGKET